MTATDLLRAFCILLVLSAVAACDTAEGPSLFDPIEDRTYTTRPNPSLSSISPAPGEALAGVTTLTLTGERFNPDMDSTFVYFDGRPQPLLSLTSSQITLKAPNLPKGDIKIKVSVLRAENFSETLTYELLPAILRADPEIGRNDVSRAVTTDEDQNIYYGLRTFSPAGSAPRGVVKVTPDGAVSSFSTSAQAYTDFEFRQGELLGTRSVAAVFEIAQGGTADRAAFITSRLGASGLSALGIDVDDQGTLWTAGVGNAVILRIGTDGSSETTPLPTGQPIEVVDVEARADFLYIAAIFGPASSDSRPSRILRFPLSGGRISGASEVYFDIAAVYPTLRATSLAFGADGSLFVGMRTASDLVPDQQANTIPLIRINAAGTSSESFFPGLMQGITYGIEWLNQGNTRLVVSGPRIVADRESLDRRSDLLIVNTLVEGER